ncbi:MAG: zinc-ribbon domain-containing protein [Desulfobulbaceae bacterium]|nr:zinc-ribbon domain-containing protein [Desulfobulbaceae bacterium]
MLVICEDCAKKYNIDESRIKGNRARFTCNECGHIIIVDKADFSRPLINKPNPDPSSSSSIDLLKEMETPLEPENRSDAGSTGHHVSGIAAHIADTAGTKKKMSIAGYFLTAGFVSFLTVNSGMAFVIGQYYSSIAGKHMELQPRLLTTSLLVLLGTWLVSFGILFLFGIYLAKLTNRVTNAIKQVDGGKGDINISSKGPRELRNLTEALSGLLQNRPR